jgi:predicted NBD/HSP70 family sugar kinase
MVPALGRPGRLVRMAAETAAVLGVVIDATTCCVVATGLDGRVDDNRTRRFATPASYGRLLERIARECRALLTGTTARVLGIGISVPGLVNERAEEIICSANIHILDKRNPARDLESRLGVPCVLLQENEGLCLAERLYGDARGLADFAMLEVADGLGLGVMSGGTLLTGHSGMAGELGHITVAPDGIRCGCGNRGCLETLATDVALVRLVSEQEGRPLDVAAVDRLLAERPADFAPHVATVTEYLAITIATVVNIFNPTALFVHGKLLAGSPDRFAKVLERVRQRALTASLADCMITTTKLSKRKGAVAGIIHHLTQAWAPAIR